MNCKLEKFWNSDKTITVCPFSRMNCKLEKFWNVYLGFISQDMPTWTVNLKSFEIHYLYFFLYSTALMNCKLEKFWNS